MAKTANDMEARRLAAFLLSLQASQSTQHRFKKNHKAEMKRFDLSPKTIDAVLGKDHKKILELMCYAFHVMTAAGVSEAHRRRTTKRA